MFGKYVRGGRGAGGGGMGGRFVGFFFLIFYCSHFHLLQGNQVLPSTL